MRIKELWNYRENIFNPKLEAKTRRGKITINFGTYYKPIARKIAKILEKRFGWDVRLRPRGDRCHKETNKHNEIKVKDSLFMAIYGRQTKNCKKK